jgi:uncharacterized protein with HEPN domain
MSPDDTVRIRHMIDAIESALMFTQGRDRSSILWSTVKRALPPLPAQLKSIQLSE